jgi:tetratricopeptide (TPR) repeat protein
VADHVIDVFLGDVSPEITLGRAADAIALFERIGDEGGLARAWRLTAWQHGSMGRVDDAANDCLHAADHGVRANDHRIANRSAMGYASYAVNGSLPAAEVAERCRAFMSEVAGDRRAEAVILGVMAQLRAMDGDFEEARRMSQRERQLLLDLGPSAVAFATSLNSSRVEVLAGDLAAAEAYLRRDDEDLERLGETYFRSTVVGKLANVVALQERADEAIRLSEIGEALAGADDLEAQILWRIARARSLAQIDRSHEATELGREAVELATKTASPVYLADASTALGDALSSAGLDADAVSAYGRAVELYAAKGDRASVERLNEKIAAAV